MRVAVVGAGIVGLAVARALTGHATVDVYEKEAEVAAHQTGHNSGVVHAGLYYEPGSLKARLCLRGAALLRDYAGEKGVPYAECGKVVVALHPGELARLRAILGRAVANGVPGVREVGADELQQIEPHARGIAAVHSPRTGIVDYVGVARALAAQVPGSLLLGTAVGSVVPRGREAVVVSTAGEAAYDLVITCAGLQSDRLAEASGDGTFPRIVPFFGDYYRLRPGRTDLVRGLIYPVPDPRYPFLGVHLTRTVRGEVLVGPNAFLALDREGYAGGCAARDVRAAVGFPGFWRFAARNLPAAVREARTVLSRREFVRAARAYLPELSVADVLPGPRGIRAQAMDPGGRLLDDFAITGRGRVVHVRNAPSPGATSALAIAEHVVEQALARL